METCWRRIHKDDLIFICVYIYIFIIYITCGNLRLSKIGHGFTEEGFILWIWGMWGMWGMKGWGMGMLDGFSWAG
jgi:hypothetical protein